MFIYIDEIKSVINTDHIVSIEAKDAEPGFKLPPMVFIQLIGGAYFDFTVTDPVAWVINFNNNKLH